MTPSQTLPALRRLQGDEELDTYFRLVCSQFLGSDELAPEWRRRTECRPDACPPQMRGIVEDGTLLGGYILLQRRMRIGAALLPTACIAAVVTAAEHRGRGVGRAMLEDAALQAVRREDALLLLDGIPDFYSRFGYVDIFDPTRHGIERQDIPDEPTPGYTVRPSALADAKPLLDLYNRHHAHYSGSFEWTLEQFRHDLDARIRGGSAPVVVEKTGGKLLGYLHRANKRPFQSNETVAEIWQAALALLQYHAPAATAPEGEAPAIWWWMPPDSATLYLLAENVPGTIQSVSARRRDSDWLARPAALGALVAGLLPAWQARWASSIKPYRGTVELRVDHRTFPLALGDDIQLPAVPPSDPPLTIRLTSRALTQLIFGYRPTWWIATQPDQQVPIEIAPALDILFPPGGFWIAGSDFF